MLGRAGVLPRGDREAAIEQRGAAAAAPDLPAGRLWDATGLDKGHHVGIEFVFLHDRATNGGEDLLGAWLSAATIHLGHQGEPLFPLPPPSQMRRRCRAAASVGALDRQLHVLRGNSSSH
jgi:hypothetical protein